MVVNRDLRDFIRAVVLETQYHDCSIVPIKNANSRFKGKTCVMAALISQDYKMFKVLLRVKHNRKYPVSSAEPDLSKLLFTCCKKGLPKYAKILLSLGADPKEIRLGSTLLMEAVKCGQTEMVRLLLPISNIEYCRYPRTKRTALWTAASLNYTDIVSDILAVSTFGTDAALNIAAQKGHIDTVRLLLNAGADTSRAMMYAVSKNHPNIVRELLIYPGINNEDFTGCTPLTKAISISLEMVRLVSSMADLNIRDKNGYTALMEAVYREKLDMIIELAPITDLDIQSYNGYSALMFAVCKNNLEIVDALLAHNLDLNLRNPNGHTALMLAVRRGHQPIVARLLSAYCNKGDINMTNKNGYTAAFIAYTSKNRDIGDMFRPYCDVPSKNPTRLTPFLITCINNNVSDLVTKVENVNQRDRTGMTPLMIAAACGHIDLIKVLLKKPRINIYAINWRNYNAMDYAVHYGISIVRKLAPYYLKLH